MVGSDGLQANIPLIGPSTWALINGMLTQEQDEIAVAAHLRGKFAALGAQHTMVVGGDHARIDDEVLLLAEGGPGLVDLADPVFAAPFVIPVRSAATTLSDNTATYVTEGIYTQLQTDIGDRVHLLGGLRLGHLRVDGTENITGEPQVSEAVKVLPRAGVLVDLFGGLSAFAGYSEGMTTVFLSAYRGLAQPEFSRQKEAGFKFEFGGGLSGSAAVFDIDRWDVPVVDNFLIPVGTSRERSQGAETDFIWQPNASLKVLASYAFVDAELVEANQLALPGSQRIGVPKHSGRLWLNYEFDAAPIKGWSVGLGLYSASEAAVNLANTFFTDPYVTVDAKIAYTTDNFTVTASAKNITDELYFVPHQYLGGRVARGEPQAFYLTVTHRLHPD